MNSQRTYPEIREYLLQTLASRLRDADEALAAATFMTVKGRVARALLELAEFVGEDNKEGQIILNHKISQKRYCRNGRCGARKCEPDLKRMAAPQSRGSNIKLLLP